MSRERALVFTHTGRLGWNWLRWARLCYPKLKLADLVFSGLDVLSYPLSRPLLHMLWLRWAVLHSAGLAMAGLLSAEFGWSRQIGKKIRY